MNPRRNYPCIDRLENRLCFAAGPTVVNEQFLGTSDEMTAVVITFSGPLDPASVQNANNFRFSGSRHNDLYISDAALSTPIYDDAAHTVTLPFNRDYPIKKFKRLKVEIFASKAGQLSDPQGNLLDGDRDGVAGGDSETRFKLKRNNQIHYKDVDGDHVSIKLRGAHGRRMTTIIGPNGNVSEIFIRGVTNTLSGKIKFAKSSDQQTVIGRVVLVDSSNSSTLVSPFLVGQTVIDGQTPVDPLVVTLP